MQNDLISRSALLEDMRKELEKAVKDESITEFECKVLMTSALALKGFVERQPTAYDVEKVTKKLNEFVLNTEQYCVEHIANGICEDCETCNECVLRKAIEIVRNGGKE